jgi:hypothetical protein
LSGGVLSTRWYGSCRMDQTVDTPDERLNALVEEVARLTGENYVTAMCQALEERRDRLLSRQSDARSPRIVRLQLEAEIPEELLRK